MNWSLFYLVCFLVGFGLSFVSFLFGSLNIHVHGHFHFHMGQGHAGAHASGGAHPAKGGSHDAESGWFNFGTVTAFLAWFGGAGFLLTAYSGLTLGIVILLALAAGTAGASIMFWFIAKVLMKHDRVLDARDYDMIGVLGTVNVPIREGGTGEIVFSQEGSRRCAGARSDDGMPIEKKAEVIVTRYEKGIAYVRRWDELAEGAGTANRELESGSKNF